MGRTYYTIDEVELQFDSPPVIAHDKAIFISTSGAYCSQRTKHYRVAWNMRLTDVKIRHSRGRIFIDYMRRDGWFGPSSPPTDTRTTFRMTPEVAAPLLATILARGT